MHLKIIHASTGIDRVLNLSFSPSFSIIMWDPPLTAGVLGSLYYHITVTSTSTSIVIINTTTTSTSYSINLQRCRNYTATVAASLAKFSGESVPLMMRIPGGKWDAIIT